MKSYSTYLTILADLYYGIGLDRFLDIYHRQVTTSLESSPAPMTLWLNKYIQTDLVKFRLQEGTFTLTSQSASHILMAHLLSSYIVQYELMPVFPQNPSVSTYSITLKGDQCCAHWSPQMKHHATARMTCQRTAPPWSTSVTWEAIWHSWIWFAGFIIFDCWEHLVGTL